MGARRLNILTWPVHGSYMQYLTQVPHDFYLVRDASGSVDHTGRSGKLPWGSNVHEAPLELLESMPFDVVLFQSASAYLQEQHCLLSQAQRNLPKIYLELDPPEGHPTDTRHVVDDPDVLLVHVSAFNELMWDSGRTPTRVIEHGVRLIQSASYQGSRDAGIVVVDHLGTRGRKSGLDVYHRVRQEVPLDLFGMASEELPGGRGEVAHQVLPSLMSSFRFFFHPVRYTGMSLSLIEAMMVGLPVVGLATAELATVIRPGHEGYIDTNIDRLVDAMRWLIGHPQDAEIMGEAARATACERFHIDRFVNDWQRALSEVTGG